MFLTRISRPCPFFIKRSAMTNLAVCVALATIILLWIPHATTQSIDSLPKPKLPKPEFVPGEVLVRFRSEALGEKASKQIGVLKVEGRDIQMNIQDIDASSMLKGLRIVHVEASETLSAIEALRVRPDVLYAEPNYVRERFVAPNDPLYPNLWALK